MPETGRSWTHPFGSASTRYERLAISICVGAMGTLGFSITAPLLPDLADAMGVDRAAIGLVQAAVSIPGVLLSVLIGYLADRFGRRRVILTSLLIFATFGVAGFWARSFWGLVGVRFLQGVGTSGCMGLAVVIVGDLFEGKERTHAMGYNLSGVTLFNMVGPGISGVIGEGGVFRPFLIFLVGYPLALWATRMPADPLRAAVSPLVHARAALASLRRGGHAIDYLGIVASTIGANVVLHGFGYTTTPLYLDSVFGIDPSGRGFIIAAFQVGIVLAAIQIGRLRATVGGAWIVGLAFAAMALGSAATAAAPTWWAVALALGLTGFGFGLYIPLAQDRAATMGGGLYRGVTVLTWVTFVRIGQVGGPPAGSWMSETVGPRATFAAAAVVMALAALAWRPVRRWAHRAAASRSETPVVENPRT